MDSQAHDIGSREGSDLRTGHVEAARSDGDGVTRYATSTQSPVRSDGLHDADGPAGLDPVELGKRIEREIAGMLEAARLEAVRIRSAARDEAHGILSEAGEAVSRMRVRIDELQRELGALSGIMKALTDRVEKRKDAALAVHSEAREAAGGRPPESIDARTGDARTGDARTGQSGGAVPTSERVDGEPSRLPSGPDAIVHLPESDARGEDLVKQLRQHLD